MTLLCRITVDGQFELVMRPPMAGGVRAGAVREFDERLGRAGWLGQMRDADRAARIKMGVGNLDLNGLGHGYGLHTLGRRECAAAAAAPGPDQRIAPRSRS